jgi:PKD repeat protein
VSGSKLRASGAFAVAIAIALIATSLASGQSTRPGTPQQAHSPNGLDRLPVPLGPSWGANRPQNTVNYSWAEINDTTDLPYMNPGEFWTVDDAAAGYLLLFGISQYYGQLQTWAFANGSWRELSPVASPSSWLSDGLAYDPAAQEVIGTGILTWNSVTQKSSIANQTWAFDAGNWVRIKTIGAPPALYGGQLSYDSNNESVVMFGGQNISSNAWSNETAIYRNGTWTNVPTRSSPPSRSAFSMASDASSGGILLFGGVGTARSGDYLNDTWTFDSGAWTNDTSTGGATPTARWGASLSIDPSLSQDVLFGGYPLDYQDYGGSSETWTYENGIWQDVSPVFSPEARALAALSYDPASGDLLLFGGCASTCYYQGLADTWIFGAFAPPIRVVVSSTPAQPAPGTLVSFTSSVLGGVPPFSYNWSFADGSPDASSPNTTHRFASTGDFYVRLTVLDSMKSTAAVSQQVSVTNVTPLTGNLSMWPAVAYVEAPVQALDSVTGGRLPYELTWSFGDGSPTETFPSSYQGPAGNIHFYAQPGSYVINVSVADGIGNSVNESTDVTVVFPSAPFLVSIDANRTTGFAPLSVGFGSFVPAGVIPTSYVWSFGDGSPEASTPLVNHTFETPGLFVVQLTVANASGGSSTSTIVIDASSTPRPPTRFQVSLTAAPGSSAAGGMATFAASVTGGSSPYSFNWSGLPAGCPSPDASSIRCTLPGYAADVVVIVNVVDSSGQRADATTSVIVLPPATSPVGPNSTATITQVLPAGIWWLMGAAAATSIACVAIAVSLAWRRRTPPPPAAVE